LTKHVFSLLFQRFSTKIDEKFLLKPWRSIPITSL
jgi:hypothetical protein